MISLIAVAASAVISCPSPMFPVIAKKYQPHHIVNSRDAIISARAQFEEFAPETRPQEEEWLRAFKARHIDAKWVLDGQIRGVRQIIQLGEKDGRLLCAYVIN